MGWNSPTPTSIRASAAPSSSCCAPIRSRTRPALFGAARQVRGIYLQPDPPFLFDGNIGSLLLGKEVEKAPDIVQRLAQQLGVESRGMSLVGKKGQRVQFGCSQRIRHTLSPDNSSLTFASKGDLAHHWLCGIMLDLERDWTWDGLEDRSLVIKRSKRFKEDDARPKPRTSRSATSRSSTPRRSPRCPSPDRSHTTLIFIDAVETKNERKRPAPHASEPRFPDLIEVEYTLEPAYKNPLGAPTDGARRAAARTADHHAAGADSEDRFGRDRAVALCDARQLLANRAAPALPLDRVRRADRRSEGHLFRARAEQRAGSAASATTAPNFWSRRTSRRCRSIPNRSA